MCITVMCENQAGPPVPLTVSGRTSEIIRGKRVISADTALRLGKHFNISPAGVPFRKAGEECRRQTVAV